MAEDDRPRTLLLLRHGQSTANARDAFSGWLDVALSEHGRREAVRAGELLAEHGLFPDVVHTSVLSRAVDTADIALGVLGRQGVPTQRSWRLNERHYGALQGRSRSAVRAEVGDALFALWRRSYDYAPPLPRTDDPTNTGYDHRYAALPPRELPNAESLADVRARVVPYWQDAVASDMYVGRTALVVAHGNSLRALCMHLDGLTPDEILTVNIPTGVPLRYDLDRDYRPRVRGGVYLDTEAAAAGAAEVAAQGLPHQGPALTDHDTTSESPGFLRAAE